MKYEFMTDQGLKTIEGLLYTGLCDVNGRKILEGDIIEWPAQDRPHSRSKREKMVRGRVVYQRDTGQTMNGHDTNGHSGFGIENIGENHDRFRYCNWSQFYRCRVIDLTEEE